MKNFLQRFGPFVLGVLHGYDRLRFRGSKRQLCHVAGMMSWLAHLRILLKEYKTFAWDSTVTLCRSIEGSAQEAGLYCYLNNSKASKEEEALHFAALHGRSQGLVAVFGCVEPCQTLQVRGNPLTKKLELRVELAKCKHYYHYYLDPDYGLRYTRLQSWFPFTMHIGLNGRDWLARQMDRVGLAYHKKDNCFTWVEDFEAAQKLAREQLTSAWPALLDRWVHESNPLEASLLRCPVPYYWSMETGEYATDFAFRTAADLGRIYPLMVRHAVGTLQSTDLLRFMGYRVRQDGKPREDLAGEVTTRIKELVEGTCVKHQIVGNRLKMYDKFAQVLRVETDLRNLRDFKVYRTREGDTKGSMSYLRMRQGVADLHGRAEVSQKINERYAESLATVEEKMPLAELTKDLGKRTQWKGRSVRALNPLAAEDVALMEAVHRGEFLISGFRNRDIRVLLFPPEPKETPEAAKGHAAKVTRLFRLLRGHGLIAKVSRTHRYQLTAKGRSSLSALLAARQANTNQLLQAA